jgi:hypothetical protein
MNFRMSQFFSKTLWEPYISQNKGWLDSNDLEEQKGLYLHTPPEEGNFCAGHGNGVKFSSVKIREGRMVLHARQTEW